MLGETYNVFDSKKFHQFSFISKGPKGGIMKMITYSHVEENLYNLGFGDVITGKISDTSITNNQDIVKVINTVAKTIYMFLSHYPDRQIYIKPVDEKRSFLYHTIFKRKLTEIELSFNLFGYINKEDYEVFNPEKTYLAFRLEKK